jgi:alkylation response protein AidB-like acyl-CoA dehydrogenase
LHQLNQLNGESTQTWTALSELGVFGIATPEAQGGSGLGATEEALIVLELGRRIVAPAVIATICASHLRSADPRLAMPGEQRVAAGYRRGDRAVIVDDSSAQLVLLRSAAGAALVERPQAVKELDAQLWSSRLLEATNLGRPLAEASAAQALRIRLVEAAVLAGIARAALDMAVAYAGMREQFGRPIGSYQAVKHHCANMALAARCASDQLSFAAVALDALNDTDASDTRADTALQVESAFYVAASAALENCGKNIQIHGGMGFSDEADPHKLLKSARVFVEIAGGLEAALTRIADCPASTELAGHAAGH